MIFDRVDRYISRVFWSSYGVAFFFFFGAFMVIDLFANVDEFVETARDLSIPAAEVLGYIAAYYMYSSPSVFLQVAPFVTVIGVIVCVTRLLQANELIPILMSGRSIYRTLRPVLVHAAILTVGMILLQELLAPRFGAQRIRLREFLTDGKKLIDLELPLEDRQGNRWSRVQYNLKSGSIVRAAVSHREDGRYRYTSPLRNLEYDTSVTRPGWRSASPFRWDVIEKDQDKRTESTDFIESSLTPEQVAALVKEAFDLSFRELGQLLAATGESRYKVLLHYHITFPLTNVLLVLLSLPFVLRYERRSRLVGLAAAFAACGLYFGADFALRGLGENHLNPVLAAWFTPIFFGALGISLFDGVRT